MRWIKNWITKWTKQTHKDSQEIPSLYPILIWGCNDFSAQLTKLIMNEKINILGFVNEESDLSTFCDKDVYSVASLQSNPDLNTIPIVIASPHALNPQKQVLSDFESVFQFKLQLQTLIEKHHITNPLMHPSALIDLMTVSVNAKPLLFGMQGAGNTLYNHLFTKLSAYKKPENCEKTSFFTKLSFEYRHAINQTLTDLLQAHGGQNYHLVPWKIGTTHVNCTIEDTLLSIFSIPTKDHMINQSFVYHQIPSEKYLTDLVANGFKPFFVIRNPLDMILSIINKNNSIDKKTFAIDPVYFINTSKWVIEQLQLWQNYAKLMPVLYYEKLLADPLKTMKEMMRSINANAKEVELKKIWKSLAFKPLPQAPNQHFWQGGSGKWETHFKREHLAFLKELGIEKVLALYGYNQVLDRFKELTSHPDNQQWQDILGSAAKESTFSIDFCIGDENSNTKEFLQTVYGKDSYTNLSSLHVTCTNGTYPEKVNKALENSYLQQFILAGTHPDKRLA